MILLYLADVATPEPAAGEVVVAVRAAGINPGEAAIRSGAPCTTGFGLLSRPARAVTSPASSRPSGPDAGATAVDDEALRWSRRRSSHATYAVVTAGHVIPKPLQLPWEVAHGMAGRARSVSLPYCEAIRERIDAAAPGGVDAFIDLFGPEHLDLAVHLAVRPNRIEMTVAIDQALTLGAKTASSLNASTPDIVAELADSVAKGAIEVPIAATYPLGGSPRRSSSRNGGTPAAR